MLRKAFGPEGVKATGEWSRLHNEELHYFYSSPGVVKVEISRACGTYGSLAGKPVGKRQLERSRCKQKDNYKMNITEIELVGMNWTALARDRNKWRAVVNAVMNHSSVHKMRRIPPCAADSRLLSADSRLLSAAHGGPFCMESETLRRRCNVGTESE